jgi:hypothetical protein
VDVLVEFAPGHTPGLEIVDIEEDLSNLLGGRRIDIVNPKYLNRRLKDRVLAEAEPRSVPMTTMRPPIPVANANLNIGRYSDFLGCIGMA